MKNRKILFHDQSMYSKNMGENFHFHYALNHCMHIYKSNSIYTYIPKNLCTSLRTTVAIENNFIDFDNNGLNWIDHNSSFFKPTYQDLSKANFTFVILRNPFGRLYSFYCDFITREDKNIDNIMINLLKNKISDISFYEFINLLNADLIHGNSHWSPQKYFLMYENYDLYVPFEKFVEFKEKIEFYSKINIKDARLLRISNGSNHFNKVTDTNYFNIKGHKINDLQKMGKIPSIKSMFSDELINLVSRLYKEDIFIYKKQFQLDPLDIFN
jgi:hypothetical protein